MTAQVNDTFTFRRKHYELVEIEGDRLFDPSDYGFHPEHPSTNCWRGFVCHYKLHYNRFILRDLTINLPVEELLELRKKLNHKDPDWEKALKEDIFPELNVVPSIFGMCLLKVDLNLPYTGRLRIGKDFIIELYVHMGFHPAFKYKEVWELEFEKGRLKGAKDLSWEMKAKRELYIRGSERGLSDGELIRWINDSFSRQFRDN